jgi:hypothetical protein
LVARACSATRAYTRVSHDTGYLAGNHNGGLFFDAIFLFFDATLGGRPPLRRVAPWFYKLTSDNIRAKCNAQEVELTRIWYKSNADFKGRDQAQQEPDDSPDYGEVKRARAVPDRSASRHTGVRVPGMVDQIWVAIKSCREKTSIWPKITSWALIVCVKRSCLSLGADQHWKGNMIKVAGLCLLLSVLSGPALAGSCVVPVIRELDNQTVNGTMYVVSGKRCGVGLLLSVGPIHSAKLVSRPARGAFRSMATGWFTPPLPDMSETIISPMLGRA